MAFDLVTIHTVLSFVAIAAGVVVVYELLRAGATPFWTVLFLATSILTSATGYLFPFNGVLPSHVVGGFALLVLAVVLAARYALGLGGPWRKVDAIGMVASLYFLVFVLVAQGFAKIPSLHVLAPTQSEPPFAIAQAAVLALFVWLGIGVTRTAGRFGRAMA
ncbi:hypothetical protein EJV46_15600 [Roseococcus sp. SYP-B2431]|uniref:hypothetical protein n=1 Tax=Roseococcus sp. SYP-B2431 TaxID=2496640 RepID=UPI00103A297E|nr:hypothetical protein [Roseococcus sp. SYP-B2431]TCH97549.1 hypothetical protein EJV46_15600 [Roseococcus sp. SYP-B2431]